MISRVVMLNPLMAPYCTNRFTLIQVCFSMGIGGRLLSGTCSYVSSWGCYPITMVDAIATVDILPFVNMDVVFAIAASLLTRMAAAISSG